LSAGDAGDPVESDPRRLSNSGAGSYFEAHSIHSRFVLCRGLQNKDAFSKSDPLCVVLLKGRDGRNVEVGRTEQIKDNLNPRQINTF
jgi:hypothetical protein